MVKIKVSSILLCTESTNKSTMPVFKIAVNELLNSHFHEVIAVTGPHRVPMEQELKGLHVKSVHNKFYERGLHSSIKAGLMNIDLDSDFFAICLANQPLLKRKDYNQLIAAAKSTNEALIICPTYQGKRGYPLFISSLLIPEILDHEDTNLGCSYLFERYSNNVSLVEMDTDACLFAADLPELVENAAHL
ncbi:MAG: NTP transferase domain-containing protein [Bacteriovorax sp.]|nr:NTP transferase domain-containing protein [Bacteriovorax sp.]